MLVKDMPNVHDEFPSKKIYRRPQGSDSIDIEKWLTIDKLVPGIQKMYLVLCKSGMLLLLASDIAVVSRCDTVASILIIHWKCIA